jgi:hypothetical protein
MGWLLAEGIPRLVDTIGEDIASALSGYRISRTWSKRIVFLLTAGLLFALILTPFLSMTAEGFLLDYQLFTTRMGGTLTVPQDAREATSYVNSRTTPDDVVLASPTIAWLLDAHAADFQMAVAATGQATQHFPAGIPSSRFRFDPRLENASYVILDSLWRGWGAAQMDNVARMVETIESEWTLEIAVGDLAIYRNPHRP